MNDDEFANISRVVREAIDDAYRLGIGAAIKIADEQHTRHPHDHPLAELIDVLRRLSAQAALLPRNPEETP